MEGATIFCDKNKDNFHLSWTFFFLMFYANKTIIIKPAHAVTSIKQSLVLKGHIFLVLSENFISFKPFLGDIFLSHR
jgi:hypothetical protein